MSFENVMQLIEGLRAELERMGVTTQVLAIVAVIAAVFFLISFREVLSWFLKVPQLRNEIRAQRAQIAEMQKSLEQMRDMLLVQVTTPDETEPPPASVAKATADELDQDEAPSKRFTFDH